MSKQKGVHFIAIGGIGMSALARILLSMGYPVSGSDIELNGRIEALMAEGAVITIGHKAQNIPADCGEVVFSSAIRADNPELMAARQRRLPIIHRGELLARLFNGGRGIAVAGAHGKTTTSSMIALIFRMMEKSPNIILGGVLPFLGSNAEKGNSDIWIVEADESDGSFLELKPDVTVVTNIEPEHMDHYETIDDLCGAFADFTNGSREAILCLDDPLTAQLAPVATTHVRSYGITAPNVELTAADIRFEGLSSRCTVIFEGREVARLELPVPGMHNIKNALGAMYAAYLDGISFADSARCLQKFTGAWRRFDILYQGDIILVDDYAHHPTEVKATIDAARRSGARRVVAVFQPHRYTRVCDLYKEFGASFDSADVIVIDEIYSAWEDPRPGITSALIVNEIAARGLKPNYLCGCQEILAFLQSQCCPGDIVLIMGAGNIRKTAEAYADYLKTN